MDINAKEENKPNNSNENQLSHEGNSENSALISKVERKGCTYCC